MAASASHYSQSRLQRDLREVLENPLPNVVGRPLEDNIFEWHVNLRAGDDYNPLSGCVFHIRLLFPPNYPNEGPELYIGSPLPHPNISSGGSPGLWTLSLWDCIPGFKGWSAAYSAHSIFLQLQAFLLREDLQYYQKNGMNQQRSVDLAQAFKCSRCAHKGDEPYPSFHTKEELEGSLRRRTKFLVSQPVISQVLKSLKQSGQMQSRAQIQSQHFSKQITVVHSSSVQSNIQQTSNLNSHQRNVVVKECSSHPSDAKQGKNVYACNPEKRSTDTQAVQVGRDPSVQQHDGGADEGSGWQTVKWGKHCLHTTANEHTPRELMNNAFIITSGKETEVSPAKGSQTISKTTYEESSLVDAAVLKEASASSGTAAVLNPTMPSKAKTSKAARKIRARTIRRRRGKYERSEPEIAAELDEGMDQSSTSNMKMDNDELGAKAMGLFSLLPVEALTLIISKLNTNELAPLSMTCRGMKEACEDGFVWKELLHRQFPATSLQAATMTDWRHAYMLESSNITSGLHCFHSKVTFEKDVLGYPIAYTINPRTKCVDYIEVVSFDLLSQTAYDEQRVRLTPNNQKFDLLLPLYINQEHFERGLPLLMRTACSLCPDMKSFTFKPEMVLSFMPKLLNTMVVLLSGKGLATSDRATDGFCSLHRLFLALCDKFRLWKMAESQVLQFVRSEKARSKEKCPSLGDFMSLLTVCSSKEASWESVIRPWIDELFDRGVLWVCKAHPNLVEKLKVSPQEGGVDEELLSLSWDGRKVGLRLAIFFTGFIHILARPPGVSLPKVAASYDALYGMASLPMKKRMQEFAKKTMEIDSWPTFFKAIGLQTPSKEYMTQWIRQSWSRSLLKGYHSNNTNFTAIQKRGVSKILLKGETTHLGVDSTVFMEEKWRYEGSIKYLDASCLVYDFSGRFMEVIDYVNLATAGMQHSGDVIDRDKQEGTHGIHINLIRLGMDVKELYFTMSGYAGVLLKDIRLPFVQLLDQKTGKELCQYHLEDKNLGEHRSVVMCRLYRKEARKYASWYVEAIGHLGAGAADNYEPIKDWIEQRIKHY